MGEAAQFCERGDIGEEPDNQQPRLALDGQQYAPAQPSPMTRYATIASMNFMSRL